MDDRTGLREIAKRRKFSKLDKGQEIVEDQERQRSYGPWHIE